MRKYKNEKTENNGILICNKCGRKLQVSNGRVMEGVCTVEVDWGYFSHKDGEHHSFDLCETCYDQLIKEFRIPVTISEKTEWI